MARLYIKLDYIPLRVHLQSNRPVTQSVATEYSVILVMCEHPLFPSSPPTVLPAVDLAIHHTGFDTFSPVLPAVNNLYRADSNTQTVARLDGDGVVQLLTGCGLSSTYHYLPLLHSLVFLPWDGWPDR